MPTMFSEFFTLASDADDFQKRIFGVIKKAPTIMGCYSLIYDYIIGGLGWRSRMFRHDSLDNTVDTTGYNAAIQQQMDDAKQYFEAGDLADPENRVLFEYLINSPQDANKYGPNVFIQKFDDTKTPLPQKASRQVQLYSQIQTYNGEYRIQLKYSKDKVLPPPPNGEITIDPKIQKDRVDPDSADKKNQLTKYVDDLVTWIQTYYPDVKALIAITDVNAFFKLVFLPGNYELTSQSVQTMLNSIRDLKDSRPRSTKKAFREYTITQLKGQATFWNNEKISNAYGSLLKFKGTSNPKLFGFFMKLFGDFLSLNKYSGESDQQAVDRRKKATQLISDIFSQFSSTDGIVEARYKAMILSAVEKVKKAYPERYTGNLLQAKEAIPANNKVNSILPDDLSYALKEKADELLKTLPLLRGKTKVRFFVIENFDDLKALNDGSVIVQNKNMSPVIVPADPRENTAPFYRPIYRAGFLIGPPYVKAIAFGNLPNFQGTFYYRPVDRPAVVTVASKKSGVSAFTIDFQNYTIEYKGMINKNTSDTGKPYKSGASTVDFFTFLKNYTKWTQIKGGRRYDPYYSTKPTNASLAEPHLTAYVAAARGAARALPLGDNSLCLWFWNCPNQTNRALYGRLGEVLGLPADRQITLKGGTGGLTKLPDVNQRTQVQIGATQCALVNYGMRKFRTDGFTYPFIGITPQNNPEEFYVQVNTPGPSVADVLTTSTTKGQSRVLTNSPKSILEIFNFSYYRRITSELDPLSNLPDFTEASKVIQLFGKNDKRKPSSGNLPQWTTDNFDAFGVNLPVCFNVKENIIRYFFDKQNRGKIINKGNSLFREEKPRKDAGTAMKPIYNKLKPDVAHDLSPTKVPATAFANSGMQASLAVQEDWGKLKSASGNYFPVNQEWCHLRGHGDGGDEYPGNFVSGSYHCNTEQLAIETGQRLITQQMAERTFVLHTTAYLLRDATNYTSTVEAERKSQILSSNYLKNEDTYNDMLANNIARRSRELSTGTGPPAKKPKISGGIKPLKPGGVAPLAAYLRYKVMNCEYVGTGAAKRTRDQEKLSKFFDFIFEGQSEFIDKNQFTIISQAVQFALSADKLKTWYDQSVAELDNKGTT